VSPLCGSCVHTCTNESLAVSFVSLRRKRRLYSGFLFAGVAGFLTYTFLEPLFVPVGSEVALVFLDILTLNAALVGMALGVLLPLIFPGVCLGTSLALLGVALSGVWNVYLFPAVGATLSLLFAITSARYVIMKKRLASYYLDHAHFAFVLIGQHSFSSNIVLCVATLLEAGALASCLGLKSMLPYLMDVARGYPYHPVNTDGVTSETPYSLQLELLFGLVWVASTLLVASALVYRDGHFRNLNVLRVFQNGYAAVPTADIDDERGGNVRARKPVLPPLHQTPPTRNDAYNMFDPADLPPRLAEYANMVFSACEDLGNFFGFQDSSVRNQAEHLLILLSNNRRYMSSHILPPSVQPPSPIHALHAKVFSNYVKWCRAMGVPPHFSKMNTSRNAPPAVASRVVDLVLYFCIWGEGANLRHMPECIWCLYHQMMEEYIRSEGYTQTRSLYTGHFLDTVITPIYNVVAKVCAIGFQIQQYILVSLLTFILFLMHRACYPKRTTRIRETTMTLTSSFGRGIA
jgi:callose synthase